MNSLVKTILFMGVLAASQSLHAAELYFDGGLGNANAESGGFDGDDLYFRVGIGGELSDTVSIEGGYWDLGEAEDAGVTASADGIYGNIKASMPLNASTRLFGKVGLYMWDSEICVANFGCGSDDGSDIFYGGGVSFGAGSGRFNVELLLTDLDDVDVTTIGASYSVPFN